MMLDAGARNGRARHLQISISARGAIIAAMDASVVANERMSACVRTGRRKLRPVFSCWSFRVEIRKGRAIVRARPASGGARQILERAEVGNPQSVRGRAHHAAPLQLSQSLHQAVNGHVQLLGDDA